MSIDWNSREVITVQGVIRPEEMGVTYPHEHLFLDAMDHYSSYGYQLVIDDEDVVASETDEDIETNPTANSEMQGEVAVMEDADSDSDEESDEESDEDDDAEGDYDSDDSDSPTATSTPNTSTQVRPFESLPSLPEDLQEAMEMFKLSIVRHKLLGWDEISRDGLLACLDALRTLAMTPPVEE